MNALSYYELAKLIAIEGKRPNRRSVVNFTYSAWIDFDSYARLLSTDALFLRQGFLDQLGLPVPSTYDYTISYCPECSKEEYHCTLFDLSLASNCPWHDVALSCDHRWPEDIISTATYSGAYSSAPYASGANWDNHSANTGIEKYWSLTRVGRNKIEHHCLQLLDWIQTLRTKVGGNSRLVSTVGRVGSSSGYNGDFFRWQFEAAILMAGELPGWCSTIRPDAARVILIKERAGVPVNFSDGQLDWHVVFKSIRRQIYSRYLCDHADCHRQLSHLPRKNLPALRSNVCSAALAYLVWQMAIRRICNHEGLRNATRHVPSFRLSGGDDFSVGPTYAANLTYALFFGIWHQLLRRCGKEPFDIVLSSEGWNKYVLCCPLNETAKTHEHEGGYGITPMVLFGFPDPKILAQTSDAKCRARRKEGESMVNDPVGNFLTRDFSVPVETGLRRMFEIGGADPNMSTKSTPLTL